MLFLLCAVLCVCTAHYLPLEAVQALQNLSTPPKVDTDPLLIHSDPGLFPPTTTSDASYLPLSISTQAHRARDRHANNRPHPTPPHNLHSQSSNSITGEQYYFNRASNQANSPNNDNNPTKHDTPGRERRQIVFMASASTPVLGTQTDSKSPPRPAQAPPPAHPVTKRTPLNTPRSAVRSSPRLLQSRSSSLSLQPNNPLAAYSPSRDVTLRPGGAGDVDLQLQVSQ